MVPILAPNAQVSAEGFPLYWFSLPWSSERKGQLSPGEMKKPVLSAHWVIPAQGNRGMLIPMVGQWGYFLECLEALAS